MRSIICGATFPRVSWRGSSSVVRLLALAGGLCAWAAPSEAEALPLVTLSASLRGLYGAATDDADPSPYAAGLGVRAGVTLPASLYLGASLDYFFGGSEEIAGLDISLSTFQLLANVGYDFGLGPLTLRPIVGLGFSQVSSDVDGDDFGGVQVTGATEDGDFALSPGVEAMIGLGLLNVGGELRYNKVFSGDVDRDAVIIGVGLGISL